MPKYPNHRTKTFLGVEKGKYRKKLQFSTENSHIHSMKGEQTEK